MRLSRERTRARQCYARTFRASLVEKRTLVRGSAQKQTGPRIDMLGPVFGVSNGTRTRDILDHNQVLYQLSYTHHR